MMELKRNVNAVLLVLLGLLTMTMIAHSEASSKIQDNATMLLTDFTQSTTSLEFYIQNDTVMGGRSNGDFSISNGLLTFSGNTNTNGGGFSSIRSKPVQLDLSNQDGLSVRMLGDGRQYTLHLQTNATWRGRKISYWANFKSLSGEWATVEVPFNDFKPRFRGYLLDGPALDKARITELGVYIYDNLDGPFEIQLDTLGAYKR